MVKLDEAGKTPPNKGSEQVDADDVEFAFKGSRTGRPGASSNQDDYDSEEEDDEEEATK